MVPPLDYAAPPSSTPHDVSVTPQPQPPQRPTPPAQRTQPFRPIQPKARPAQAKTRSAESSDSSSEVLPLAEPIAPAPGARWADPVDTPQAAPLMEAEVVEPPQATPLMEADVVDDPPYAEPQDLTGNVFSQSVPYADPVDPYQPLLAAAPLPPPPAKKRRKKAGGIESTRSFSEWVAYAVLFFLLPVSALFALISFLLPLPPDLHDARPRHAAPRMGSSRQVSPPLNPFAADEPSPSGYPITLWNANKRFSGEFSVEYRQDRGPLDGSRQYYWVVSDPSGKIEFPIPANMWKKRDKLSGKPAAAAPGQFTGPYTTFIEEQIGSSRNRISNDVRVSIGP